MADSSDTCIVPAISVTGSLHFAEISKDGTAKDVIDTLLLIDGVKDEILGSLEDYGWGLQRIRVERSGRTWEEDELVALGDGVLPANTQIAPLINAKHRQSAYVQRHFSSFAMTGHLHNPALRLVSLHPQLSITLSFLKVPEIHDGYEYKVFISQSMTVGDVVSLIMEELGLPKTLPIPGVGNLEYVLEEVWVDKQKERASRVPADNVVFSFTHFPFSPNPFKSSARRQFRFCVPEEWYRRSESRTVAKVTPSESTIRRLAALQESEEEEEETEESEEEGEGTAKAKKDTKTVDVDSAREVQKRGLVTQGRLSSMFEGWLPPASPKRASMGSIRDSRKSVSEPKLLQETVTGSNVDGFSKNDEGDEESSSAFEEMLDELGLKGEKRTEMRALPLDRKKYLLEQNRKFKTSQTPSEPHPSYSASYGPSSAAALLPKIVPQLTGDAGLLRRLSIMNWTTTTSSSASDAQFPNGPSTPLSSPKMQPRSITSPPEAQPLQAQSTGGLWSSWWASSGGERGSSIAKAANPETAKSAKWYIDTLQTGRAPDMKLVKHLIALRVHLSTAKVAFIQDFVRTQKGLDTLGTLLTTLIGKGGSKRRLTEVETTALMEVIKCFRVIMNTELGFNEVLASPDVITRISYALNTNSLKLHTHVAELLGAICILSSSDGHKAVLAALSDFRIAYSENYRFETLLSTLRLPEADIDDDSETGSVVSFADDDGIWEARVATMSLANALINCPDDLEERILLRDEFGRRGLNELLVALRYIKPPDSLLTQINIYTEDKFEDEEDMRDRARDLMGQVNRPNGSNHVRPASESDVALEDLIQLAKQHKDLYPTMLDILKHYAQILQRDMGLQIKADLFTILDRFVQQAAMLENFDTNWHIFLKRFASSVEHITGQELEVREAGKLDSREIIEEELNELRSRVEELTDERTELRNELNERLAEVAALKSLPLNVPVPNPNPGRRAGAEQNFHGLVQRLVQKEKQVQQLQMEVDKFKAQNPAETREADEKARRERDRIKWNTLMEEITKQKAKVAELENATTIKDKEILYLKRAMESVYHRFLSREEIKEMTKTAEMDAETIANRAVERLTQREEEIRHLRTEVSELNARLAARPKTEQEFKAKSPPPPPPGRPKKLDPSLLASIAQGRAPAPAPPPPPPPPPPPLRDPSASEQATSHNPAEGDTSDHPPLPPPPPPPPPPPSADVLSVKQDELASFPPPPPPPPPPPLPAHGGSLPVPSPAPTASTTTTLLPHSRPQTEMARRPHHHPRRRLALLDREEYLHHPPPPPSTGFKLKPNMKKFTKQWTKPAKKMKPFFWNKLSNTQNANTVWNEASLDIQVDLRDLEAVFTIDDSPATKVLQKGNPKKQNVTTLLDITRANNVSIMLSRFKLDLAQIRIALLELDDEKLSVDHLKAISKQLPTLEEVERIKSFDDVKKLSKADQYFNEISDVPRLSQRLDCMQYRRKLDLEIEEIRPDLNTLHNASKELRGSHRFKQTLQVVLVIGNTLNGQTFRGNAQGFQLDSLLKLRETRTAKGGKECPTLLHYLAKVLLKKDPSLTTFIDELPNVESAARVSVQTTMQTVNSLVNGLSIVKDELAEHDKLPNKAPNDKFSLVMRPFVSEAAVTVEALKNMGSTIESELRSLLQYFGENPDSPEAPKPEDFFALVVSFSSSLQKCALEVHDYAAKAAPIPKVIEPPPTPREPTLKVPSNGPDEDTRSGDRTPTGTQSRNGSVGRGDLDHAIRSMRAGTNRMRNRARQNVNKIFVDGANTRPVSRLFDT